AMSYDKAKLGAETILDAIARSLPVAPTGGTDQESRWLPTWRYRWRLRDKNMRGRLMPNLDDCDIRDRATRFGQLLGLQPPATITDIGSKVLLLSNRVLPQAMLLRRAIGRFL
ncbi:MAG TPA: hypothetical protein VF920_08060, partial [Dongiaceae bacterium]